MDEETQKLVERALKQREYHRQRYYQKKYGTDAPPLPDAKRDVHGFRDVKFLRGTRVKAGHGSGKLRFADGDGAYGEPGWYVDGVHCKVHVPFAEELFASDITPMSWELLKGVIRNATVVRIGEEASVAQCLRNYLSILCTATYVHKVVIETDLAEKPLSYLYIEQPLDDVWWVYHIRSARFAFNYYWQSVDVIHIEDTSPAVTIGEVITRGRVAWEIAKVRRKEALTKAQWLRDKVMTELGFRYDSTNGSWYRNQIVIADDSTVHINGKYVCIVWHGQYNVTKGGDDDFPTDDMVAAKALCLATNLRDQISTLAGHRDYLRRVFKSETDNHDNVPRGGPRYSYN